ncbi:hypothetical protein [Halocatena pleomorpha]|uniref:Uncharacterized protein n=1 Tax=Halocatena pleomorpha TaxID=1785090 RepID=A0A3P3RBM4_9EURY|nr:hypothetical protein [Halocatena pleomorpha]RRJ30369.1 hypothetical protein EIK79_10650 [Halocatena pleomorpha]
MADDPMFEIPAHPERRYTNRTVYYEGDVAFMLTPMDGRAGRLEPLLTDVLDTGPYRYGDWFDLPIAVFLVHDEETSDTFRVSIRDGAVRLHVLPDTTPAGLRAIYDRLVQKSTCRWTVDRRVDV